MEIKKENKRLKILFLPYWYPNQSNPTSGIFIREHAKAVSLYNEVIVIYSEGYEKKLKEIWQILSDKKEDGIRTIRIKSKKFFIPTISYLFYLWSIWQAFLKLLKEGWKPDIIHAHVYSSGVPAVILGKIYKIPALITEHSSEFLCHTLNLFQRVKARFGMNRVKIILPVSGTLKEAIKFYGIKNNFEIIPDVVDTKIFHPAFLTNQGNKKKILFVGNLKSQKGVSYLLQSLFQLKQKRQDFLLDIIGNGPEKKEYEWLSKKLGLDEIVRFQGLKSKEEIAEFMRESCFVVIPSFTETFNVVCIEAMACGKPIIATNLPVLKEKITQEAGILVPPKDINALTKAIDYMLDHYQNYSPEKISQYAKENFSYEVIGKKLDDIYRKVINLK